MYKTPQTEQSELLPMHNLVGASGDVGISETPADPSKEVF